MFRVAAAVLTIGLLTFPAVAGEFNKKVSIGDQAPVFKDLEGVNGKKTSLDDFKNKELVVIVITCNQCPVSMAYEDRIIQFSKKYAGPEGKVALVAINVHNNEDDRLPKMKERAAAKGFTFPYLHDPTQEIARKLGASRTPEFFLLNKERKIVYMGAMDNDWQAEKADTHFLEAAVVAVLKGEKPAKAETAPFGCGVEYEKKK
jgi:peroxiredoxin